MKPEISQPCHENWENMKIGMISRHCESCNKNVIDFTSYSREELLHYLINHRNEKTCGRLLQSQLDFHHEEILVTIEALLTKNKSKNIAFLLLPLAASILMNCSDGKDKQTSSAHTNKLDSTLKVTISAAPTDTVLEDAVSDAVNHNSYKAKIDFEELTINLKKPFETEMPTFMGFVSTDLTSGVDGLPAISFFQSAPEYLGGVDSLFAFLKTHLIYPDYEKKNKIEGTVYVDFLVESDGKISNAKILKSVVGSKNFDREVLRVINSMPAWTPGIRNGKNAAVNYTLPIKFKL